MAEIKFGTGGFGASVRMDSSDPTFRVEIDPLLRPESIEDFLRNEDKGDKIMLSKEEFQSELDRNVEQLEKEKSFARSSYQTKRLSLYATRNTQLSERVEELESETAMLKATTKSLRQDADQHYENYLDVKYGLRDADNEMFWCKFTLAVSIPVVALITYILTTAIALSK